MKSSSLTLSSDTWLYSLQLEAFLGLCLAHVHHLKIKGHKISYEWSPWSPSQHKLEKKIICFSSPWRLRKCHRIITFSKEVISPFAFLLKAYDGSSLKTDVYTPLLYILPRLATFSFRVWGYLPNIYLFWCSDTSAKSDLEQVTF